MHTVVHVHVRDFWSFVLAAELAERQVSREEGTKDTVTGSRLRTSVCQLCVCLHLTPAKSPSGSLSHSPLHITAITPPPHLFLPTVEETLQLLLKATAAPPSISPSHTHTPPGTVGLDLATASSGNWLDSKVIKVIKANWGYWGKRDPVKCVAENWASDRRKNGDGMDFREKRLIHGGHMCHGSHMTDIAITAFFLINTNPLHHVANNRKNTWHSQGNLCPPFVQMKLFWNDKCLHWHGQGEVLVWVITKHC